MAIATVTNIFKLKDGNAFESAKVKKAVEELSREKGVLRQYWGEQVENPGLFTWVLDYESAEDAARVAGTEVYRTARNNLEGFLEVIDQINLGLTTKWYSSTEEVDAAMQSAITEVAFFTFSSEHTDIDSAKAAVDKEMDMICENVKIYGNARGAAVGWVQDDHSGQVLLHGVFGYDCLEDHMEWRKHYKIKDAEKAFAVLRLKGMVLMADERVKGVDVETGYFHVKFEHA